MTLEIANTVNTASYYNGNTHRVRLSPDLQMATGRLPSLHPSTLTRLPTTMCTAHASPQNTWLFVSSSDALLVRRTNLELPFWLTVLQPELTGPVPGDWTNRVHLKLCCEPLGGNDQSEVTGVSFQQPQPRGKTPGPRRLLMPHGQVR